MNSGVILTQDLDEAIRIVDSAQVRQPPTSPKGYEEAKNDLGDNTKELAQCIKRLMANKNNVIQLGSSSRGEYTREI